MGMERDPGRRRRLGLLGAVLTLVTIGLTACVTVPTGPSVAVMPAPNKPFEVFAADEQTCRQYAQQMLGGSANDHAAASAVGSAAVGTMVGAAAGAAVGGHAGAGAGAAVGLVTGSAVGAGQGNYVSGDAQRRYNTAYLQCMYAKGNQIPSMQRALAAVPPPPAGYPPPPPPKR